MADHWGRWVQAFTYLYPASGVAVTTVTVGRWTWKHVRPLQPGEDQGSTVHGSVHGPITRALTRARERSRSITRVRKRAGQRVIHRSRDHEA